MQNVSLMTKALKLNDSIGSLDAFIGAIKVTVCFFKMSVTC
ncbi:MAG: hypothetical protein Q8N96_02440 [Methylovulum sp.]|nr:hypothetical protein [Methylovulum sp.]